MISLGGNIYIIDFDAIEDMVTRKEGTESLTETEEVYQRMAEPKDGDSSELDMVSKLIKTTPNDKDVNGVKFEMVRQMIDTIFTESLDVDEKLGWDNISKDFTVAFRFAFNTLLHYGIIKEVEE